MKSYKAFFIIVTPAFVTFIFLIIADSKSTTTINYFPIDRNATFEFAYTTIQLNAYDHKGYEILWTSNSKTDQTQYLRQDISMLYSNGALKGILSKWKEKTDHIYMQMTFSDRGENVLDAISYHHGEIHHSNNKITSIHTMSNYILYITKQRKSNVSAFVLPSNAREHDQKQLIDLQKANQLSMHWSSLINNFSIDIHKYTSVPFTDLYVYDNEPLPDLSSTQTEKIIGQLWEGMYKNYVIPALEKKNDSKQFINYIPLILFSKDNTHLLVLFELNGKKEKLIQRYSF
ncbi:hypothetical protein ACLIBH_12050 [Virgibacillus sp. W0430]|uniref:hypothetical protein n=1 Tax=Virgibacillus sp. W0430 TaxID=3391580 RepID=UPI003F4630A3